MFDQMQFKDDVSTKNFTQTYYRAVESINQKKKKQDDALYYLQNNKENLRQSLESKNEYINGESDRTNIGIKLLKLKVQSNENPYIKLGFIENGQNKEVGKVFNDEHNPISFLRDHVFSVE